MPVFVAIMEEYDQVEILQDEKEINEGIKENLQVKGKKKEIHLFKITIPFRD